MNESPEENPYLTLEGFCRLPIEGGDLAASVNQGGYHYPALPIMESGSGLSYLLHMVQEHMPERYLDDSEEGGNLTVPTFELDLLFAKPDMFRPMVLVWKKTVYEILRRMKKGITTSREDIEQFLSKGLEKEWSMLRANPDPSFGDQYQQELVRLEESIWNVMEDFLIKSLPFGKVSGLQDNRSSAFLLGNLVYLSIRDPSLFSQEEMQVLEGDFGFSSFEPNETQRDIVVTNLENVRDKGAEPIFK